MQEFTVHDGECILSRLRLTKCMDERKAIMKRCSQQRKTRIRNEWSSVDILSLELESTDRGETHVVLCAFVVGVKSKHCRRFLASSNSTYTQTHILSFSLQIASRRFVSVYDNKQRFF